MAGETVIGDRYRLDGAPLGTGGMGTVWGAVDTTLARRVAVKLITSPDEELTRRFLRECRITAELRHPGVPAVYDIGTHEGSPFLVMEFIDGCTVADLVAEEEGLSVGWATAIAAQTCAVLAMAHCRRRVHRDLKPGNLMICPDGSVKVFDFGLAGALEPGDLSRITSSGQQLGTLRYMAPEQIRSERVCPQTDLYALGCVLYEMLSGDPPFTGTSWEVTRGHMNRRPRPVRSQHGQVPPELGDLINGLLAKKPEDRPSGAVEVYTRLAPFVSELRPLSDAVRPAQGDPLRLYASIVARVGVEAAVPIETYAASPMEGGSEPSTAGAGTSPPSSPSPRKIELRYARDEALTLMRYDRFTEAAETLGAAVNAAAATDGRHDPEVLDGRLQLAELLFEGADYPRAAEVFHVLAVDVVDRFGPGHELALTGRRREADCHAAEGELTEAADGLMAVIPDLERVHGLDHDRSLDARLQAGQWLSEARDPRARAVLVDLRSDLVRWRGRDHPALGTIEELLSRR